MKNARAISRAKPTVGRRGFTVMEVIVVVVMLVPVTLRVTLGGVVIMPRVVGRPGCRCGCVQGLLSCKAAAGASQWS